MAGHILTLSSAGALLLLSTVIGCNHSSRTLKDAIPESSDGELVQEPILLEVENRNWADVIIYLLVDGRRYRFLQVRGAKEVSKEIPKRQQGSMGMFRFAIHRIGSQDEFVTEQVSIRTGRTVRLTLESELHRSSIAVF
jgi:hypothetical protein